MKSKYRPDIREQELIDYWNSLSPVERRVFYFRVRYWIPLQRHIPYYPVLLASFFIAWLLLVLVVPVNGALLEITTWCAVGAGVLLASSRG